MIYVMHYMLLGKRVPIKKDLGAGDGGLRLVLCDDVMVR